MSDDAPRGLLDAVFPPVTTLLCRRMQPGLYRYVWRVSAPQQVRLCLLTALVAPLAMAPLELQRRMVDGAIRDPDIDLLLSLGGLYLAVVLLHGGLKYVRNLYQGRVSEGVVRVLRRRIAREAGDDEADGTQGENGGAARGTLVSMAAAEAEQLGGFVAESLAGPLLQLGTLVAVLGYMFWIEPGVAALALALFVPSVTLVPLLQNRINRLVAQRTKHMRALGDAIAEDAGAADADDNDDAAEADGANTRHAGSDESDAAYNARIDRIYGIRIRIYRLKFLLKALNNLLGHLGTLGILLLGGWLVIQGETELGTIVAFISGFERIQGPSRDLLALYRQFSRMRVQYRLFADRVGGQPAPA